MKWLPFLSLAVVFSAQANVDMCFNKAGHDYGIDPLLLTAISIKESRLKMTAINGSNSDKTEDVCGMQVNSSHYASLMKFNITRERLLKEPCICIYSGAWVLARNFKSYGRNWDSVGMYNTGPSIKLIKKRKAYAEEIKNIYRVLLATQILEHQKITDKKLSPLTENMTASLTQVKFNKNIEPIH